MLSSHPEGDRLENSVRSGDLLLAEYVLQVVVVYVGVKKNNTGSCQSYIRSIILDGMRCSTLD